MNEVLKVEEKAVVISVLLLVFVGLGISLIHFSSLGEGEHYGQITSVDQRGYFFRNYDLYFKSDASSSQEDEYCIFRSDTELVEKAKQAILSKAKVLLKYQGVRGFGWGLCSFAQITDIQLQP